MAVLVKPVVTKGKGWNKQQEQLDLVGGWTNPSEKR